MADSKITDLTLATTITGDDVLPIVNGGSTKKVTVTKIKEGLATTTYVDTQDNLKVDKVAGSRLITSAESTLLGNTSGTNTGDNATNSQYSGLATSKYDASNPSGYQTAGQVQTIADAKVVQTITNGVTATAPSQDAVFDALATKQATLVSATNIKTINGTTILGSGDLVVSGGGSITLSAIGASPNANGATITGSVLNLQPADVANGGVITTGTQTFGGAKTFNNQIQASSGILGNPDWQEPYNVFTTNGYFFDISTKQDSVIATYSVIANSTNGASYGTNFAFRKWDLATYTPTPTWTGTGNPTVLLGNSYSGQQVGNMVSINIALVYSVAGNANTQVLLPLPSDFPTPLSPTGLTGALDILAYGSGMIVNATNPNPPAVTGARNTLLRRNSANTGYEFFMNVSVALNAKLVILNLTYQTS